MGHKEPSRPHSKGPKRDLTQICFASPAKPTPSNGDATAPNHLKSAPNGKLVNHSGDTKEHQNILPPHQMANQSNRAPMVMQLHAPNHLRSAPDGKLVNQW